MAHGTGRYLIRNFNTDIKNEEYIVFFTRVRNYYYEDMSDCYEPTWEDEDEYEATIRKWRINRYGEIIADEISEGYSNESLCIRQERQPCGGCL